MQDIKHNLISILMPTYNVAPFVEEAVISILHQTYHKFELIIVDDCSTDGTYEILSKLAESDRRIILEKNDVNSKICITLNKAWQLAKGEYIGRMDGDDISAPERLALLKKHLDDNPDIDLVGSQIISIDEEGNVLSRKKYLRTPFFIKKGNAFAPCVSHVWLSKRKVYESLGGYRNIPYAEDYDFLLRGEQHCFRYANIEEYVYQVRNRYGNTGSTNGLKQVKTKYYVQAINRGKSSYAEATHKKALECTAREEKDYCLAYKCLNMAIKERKTPLMLMWHTLKGCFYSKYVFQYIVESIIVRLFILIEDIIMPRKKRTIILPPHKV